MVGYFNPLPLYRGRLNHLPIFYGTLIFQSSPSIQRETQKGRWYNDWYMDFNPLPLYRGRPVLGAKVVNIKEFQSSPSIQRETVDDFEERLIYKISILSLYTEGDALWKILVQTLILFQSSPSIQRETLWRYIQLLQQRNFNPLPLYRGRHHCIGFNSNYNIFQSSPSIQRETSNVSRIYRIYNISILSLYTEGDDSLYDELKRDGYFNPLPLYRGRPLYCAGATLKEVFQSSPSIQRETKVFQWQNTTKRFQSSPSIQRETVNKYCPYFSEMDFNPLPLYRGRQNMILRTRSVLIFQSSPSIQRETENYRVTSIYNPISILSLYTEGDCKVCLLYTSPSPRD